MHFYTNFKQLEELEKKVMKAKERQGESFDSSCTNCQKLQMKMDKLTEDLKTLIGERKCHLEELFDMKYV